jgi:hypothetical protein
LLKTVSLFIQSVPVRQFILLGVHPFLAIERESTSAQQPLEFMGSALSKVKGFFASERDSEASTRANTKTNAKPIPVPVAPIRRTQSIDSPRAARALSENGAAVSGSPGSKKQKIKRQVFSSFQALCAWPSSLTHFEGIVQSHGQRARFFRRDSF